MPAKFSLCLPCRPVFQVLQRCVVVSGGFQSEGDCIVGYLGYRVLARCGVFPFGAIDGLNGILVAITVHGIGNLAIKAQTESSAVRIATMYYKGPIIKEARTTSSFARRPYCTIAVLVVFYYPICLTFVFLLVFVARSPCCCRDGDVDAGRCLRDVGLLDVRDAPHSLRA